MKIVLSNISKRYNRNWVFKDINYEFSSEQAYVISGANGSGKSTLLQLLSGSITPTQGIINYYNNSIEVENEKIYSSVSIAAPYLDLIEAYTLKEMIDFHFNFKSFCPGITIEKFIEVLNLDFALHKPIKEFSSGMRQRVKLALAILSDTPLLLLDEPLANLDKKGVAWYKDLMDVYRKNRLVIVCSNQQKDEYEFCSKELLIEDFK